ncbi:unnamed protein product [marine sediment metagenome]|uniref:Uncharacterized protein n=1 Tax=marine sediment metagenome TaxID=412755 RepID=X1ASY9_9ZZZZ
MILKIISTPANNLGNVLTPIPVFEEGKPLLIQKTKKLTNNKKIAATMSALEFCLKL